MGGVARHPWRVASRLVRFLGANFGGILDHYWNMHRRGLGTDPRACADWLQRWSRRHMESIDLGMDCVGRVPSEGLIVSNHLGYIDIPLLAVTRPMVFVSKAEVANWPIMGALARCGGTLFLKREQRGHVAEIAAAFQAIIDTGTVITLFPEGTSTGGDEILPFRPSLFEPAVANGWTVTPAWVGYRVEGGEGTVSDDVAYWRDMTFGPHFLGVLAKRRIMGRVHYGEPVRGIRDRKELAKRLHAEVCALKARHEAALR